MFALVQLRHHIDSVFPHRIAASHIHCARIILYHQVQAVQQLVSERTFGQIEALVGSDVRSIVVIQFPVIEIRHMDSDVYHLFPREMLGHSQVVAIPITVPGGRDRTKSITVRTRTRVIRSQYHLRCPRLPPTFFPQP